MKTEIITYSDMSEVDDTMLDSIIEHEERTLGKEEYREGIFCSNRECRRVEPAQNEGEPCSCPDCGSPMLAIFDQRVIKPILYADLYRNAYGSVLRDEAGVIRGTCVIQATYLRSCFHNMNFLGGYDWEKFRERVEDVMGIEAEEDTAAICANRLCIDREYRKGGMFMKLGSSCGDIMKPEHNEWPSFSSVKHGGTALPVLEGVGHQLLLEDRHDAVIVGLKRFGDFRRAFDMEQKEFETEYGGQITKAAVADRMRQANKGARYYRGVALLDEIQEAVENLYSKG